MEVIIQARIAKGRVLLLIKIHIYDGQATQISDGREVMLKDEQDQFQRLPQPQYIINLSFSWDDNLPCYQVRSLLNDAMEQSQACFHEAIEDIKELRSPQLK